MPSIIFHGGKMTIESRTVLVTEVKENADGSATISFDFTEQEREALFRAGVIEAIKAGVKKAEPYNPEKATKFDNKSIELTWDQIDSIVVSELKEAYERNTDENNDFDIELLNSFDKVLKYFMSASDYDDWKAK